MCPAAAELPAVVSSKDLQHKSGTVMGALFPGSSHEELLHGVTVTSYKKEMRTGNGCFCAGRGVPTQWDFARSSIADWHGQGPEQPHVDLG